MMALYHFQVAQLSRGKGQSAVASAAYRSGEKLYDEYYNETHDYTRKGGVLYSEILLPDHVPKRLANREVLWNELESVEKHPKAQLAYSFDIALQNELSYEENLDLARTFVAENFVARGMIADLSLHDPHKGNNSTANPHFHVMCPIRPIDPDGNWGAKQHRQYVLDENGERIKKSNGTFQFNSVPSTDWGQPETLMEWRKNWADLVNRKFEEKGIPDRIDHRSYIDQGIDLIPSIHEGPAVRAMEARGIRTDKGDFNRLIKKTNILITQLVDHIRELAEWISALCEVIREEKENERLAQLERKTIYELTEHYFWKRMANAYSRKGFDAGRKKWNDAADFLRTHKIQNLDDLASTVSDLYSEASRVCADVKSLEKEMAEIRKDLDLLNKYITNRPAYDSLCAIKNKNKSDRFKEEHNGELSLYYMARRALKEKYPDRLPDPNTLRARLKELEDKHKPLFAEYKRLKETANLAYTIKKAIEADYKRVLGEPEQHREREDAR